MIAETGLLEPPIYSTLHPEYLEDDSDEEETKLDTTIPASDSEIDAPAKDVPAAADISAPAEAMITQEYMAKGVFFLLIMLAILYVVRRRRTAYQKLDEKSMA
jgi:hypothetical protein